MPARPLAKFRMLHVGKRNFLDGGPRFRYALLRAFQEYMIMLKTKELAAKGCGAYLVSAGRVRRDRRMPRKSACESGFSALAARGSVSIDVLLGASGAGGIQRVYLPNVYLSR